MSPSGSWERLRRNLCMGGIRCLVLDTSAANGFLQDIKQLFPSICREPLPTYLPIWYAILNPTPVTALEMHLMVVSNGKDLRARIFPARSDTAALHEGVRRLAGEEEEPQPENVDSQEELSKPTCAGETVVTFTDYIVESPPFGFCQNFLSRASRAGGGGGDTVWSLESSAALQSRCHAAPFEYVLLLLATIGGLWVNGVNHSVA
ncbi:hypothetical protein DFH08DRAFT_814696 [Mycena albidolilacea]|uniref:Uncharacterized protein n=1 Tax=Mycena albidolilacea TaxID=1033008 RepID=A0AAD7EKB3_9AGAR|nr:hypothetical protein DFH08DRAFT_814696 [Mycena albidolilacea]